MSKFIDADKLKAEIERRIAQWQPYTFACASQIASEAFDRIDELKGLLIYITSLQQEQPDVDLEKEINACWRNWLSPSNQKEVEGVLPKTEFAMYARHFYELGLNARKEK